MVLRYLLKAFLCLCLLVPVQALAADPTAAPEAPASDATAPAFPGLSELGPRSSALADFVAKSEEDLKQLTDLSAPNETLKTLSEQFQKLTDEIKPLGSPDDWYVDRLTQYLGQFGQLRQNLDNLQGKLTSRQQEVERIRTQARQDADFWETWAAELKQQKVQLPQQTLTQVKQLLARLDTALKKGTDPLLKLQEQIGIFQQKLISASDDLTQALEKLRKATFRKNAHSFFSIRFFQQFNSELWQQVRTGLVAAYKFDPAFFEENSFQIGLMLLVLVATVGTLMYYRSRFKEMDEWQFVLKHPLAAGSFVAVVMFSLLSPALTTLLRFLLQVWGVIAATSMAVSLVENRRQAWVLSLAALVFLITSGFRIISLPQPLFRLYIAVLALVFIPLLLQQVALSRKYRGEKAGRSFRALLRLAVAVLAISLVGQAAGYINFSTWMIQATFETGMLILFARMTLLLSNGAIDVLKKLLIGSGRIFFIHYGNEMSVRLKRLFRVIIVGFAFFYLLPVWRIFTTLDDAWSAFSQFGFTLGEAYVTVQMLGLAVLAFYLAMQLSWLLQGMSETQFFSRRSVDRGVRDAIKKLIHYGIVLIGFLIALGFLGLRLQNFIVLLGAFGVGIGFGLQDIVNNFLSGLIMLFERPIKVGDGILIDGEYGTVSRIGLRSTVVVNLNHAELIVPNSQIISQKVTNWTLSSRQVRLTLPVGVAYGSDLEKVLRVLSGVAEKHPEILDEPAAMPLFIQFGASSLDFELRAWIANVDDRPRVQNELLLEIDRRFREEKIEIPFPQHDLHLRSVAAGILPGNEGR